MALKTKLSIRFKLYYSFLMDRQCEESILASNGKASIEGNAQQHIDCPIDLNVGLLFE
jgi:hypothetical protein